MENKREKNAVITKKGREVYTECMAEYVLPDYKGDIKRIMHAEARAMESGHFVGEDSSEFNGVVVFDVLYVSADDELTSVSFTSDYTVRTEKEEKVYDVTAKTACEGVNVRLPGPRKISARARVVLSLFEDEEALIPTVGTTFLEENEPETLCEEIKAERIIRGTYKDREYAEELFSAVGAAVDDVSVVSEQAVVRVNSAVSFDGGVMLEGEICVSCITVKEGTCPIKRNVKIPFEERVEASDVKEGMNAFGFGNAVSLSCAPVPTDDGVRVNANVIVDFAIEAYANTKISVVKDAYSKVCDVENKYKELGYTEYLDTKRSVSRISRDVPKKATELPLATDVVSLYATPKIESVTVEGTSVKVDGEIAFSGVACEVLEGDKRNYASIKVSAPYSEKVNFSCQIPENTSTECAVEIIEPRVTLDGENFYFECGLALTVTLSSSKSVTCLVSSESFPSTKVDVPTSTVNVYYPDASDSLFEIAKVFKTSVRKIAEDNALTEETVSVANIEGSLSSVKKLIIAKL